MPKDDHYLSERHAFWTLLAAQQVVTVVAVYRLVTSLRPPRAASVLTTFYSLVLLYSLGKRQSERSAFFLDAGFDYTLIVYELLDVAAISLYLCLMSVFCWLWWDIFLQFTSPFTGRRRTLNTLFFIGVDASAAAWNFLSLLIFYLLNYHAVVSHYAATECFCLGFGVQRAAQRAKSIVHSLLKTSSKKVRLTQISIVQIAGVTCSMVRGLTYTLEVALYRIYEETRHDQPGWLNSVLIVLFYLITDLLPLTILLWIVRTSQEQQQRLSEHVSSNDFSEARISLQPTSY